MLPQEYILPWFFDHTHLPCLEFLHPSCKLHLIGCDYLIAFNVFCNFSEVDFLNLLNSHDKFPNELISSSKILLKLFFISIFQGFKPLILLLLALNLSFYRHFHSINFFTVKVKDLFNIYSILLSFILLIALNLLAYSYEN